MGHNLRALRVEFDETLTFEQEEIGLSWGNAWESPHPHDTYSFGFAAIVLFIDGIIYGLIAVMVLVVKSCKFSTFTFFSSKHFTFFSDLSRPGAQVAGQNRKSSINGHKVFKTRKVASAQDNHGIPGIAVTEPEEQFNPEIGVSLINISKTFSFPNKPSTMAVNDVTIDFHMGKITALLGHNGAGKSTIM